ncbi:transcription factor 24 [Pogona vitticeps]|uniref:Transcription factor 24 n=1 Tax=Pogona vitticeps TaxID=103695 RepID=A0A6J0V5V3_9SAUR|nr:transcription factor 24 [Pogona vitticeps]
MDYRNVSDNCKELPLACSDASSLPSSISGTDSLAGQRTGSTLGRPAAANAARERSRVQTLRHAFLELQRTLPSVPPDTKLSKLDVLLLATTYIAHLTRSLQDEEELPGEALGTLRGDGYLHPVKKWPMRSRLYIGASGQFLSHSLQTESTNQGETSTNLQM